MTTDKPDFLALLTMERQSAQNLALSLGNCARDLEATLKRAEAAEARLAEVERMLYVAVTLDVVARSKKARKHGEERVPCYFSCDWIDEVQRHRSRQEKTTTKDMEE